MSDARTRLGRRVRELRLKQEKTQEELGERSGVSYKQIGEIELGKANPQFTTLESLAKGLGVRVADLFVTAGDALYPETDTEHSFVRELRSSLEGALETLNRGNRKRAPRRSSKR